MTKFNPIQPPFGWEESWTKYPHGYTIYEALLDWIKTVNGLIDSNNTLNQNVENIRNELNTFYDIVRPELYQYAVDLIEQMKEDGDFDVILGTLVEDINIKLVTLSVNVRDHGAVGNGLTNDTLAIQTAVGVIKTQGGGVLVFPKGTYLINSQIDFIDMVDFTVKGNNSIIKVMDGTSSGTGFAGFRMTRCFNFTVRDLTIDGNRDGRSPAELPSHLFYLLHCNDFTFDKAHAINGTCDGYLISATNYVDELTYSKRGKLLNLTCDNNFRQGLTVGNVDQLIVENCVFSNTNGTAPESGIDVEPNAGTAKRVIIENCQFKNNNGKGILFADDTMNSSIIRCHFDSDQYCGIEMSNVLDILVEDNQFIDYLVPLGRGIVYIRGGSKNVVLRGNVFRNNQTGRACIHFFNTVSDCVIRDNFFMNCLTAPFVLAGANHVLENNTIDTVGGIGIDLGASASHTLIINNRINKATGRAIYDAGSNTRIINNRIVEITSLSGAVIQSVSATPYEISNNYIEQVPPASVLAMRFTNNPVKVLNNRMIGTNGISYDGGAVTVFDAYNDKDGVGVDRIERLLLSAKKIVTMTAAPTTGTWNRGDIVFMNNPSAGGNVGWVCITAGTPGTWKTFGAIAA